VSALHVLAPTVSETPSAVTELVVLVLFIALGVAAVWHSRSILGTKAHAYPTNTPRSSDVLGRTPEKQE
jgi:hypothetical protein